MDVANCYRCLDILWSVCWSRDATWDVDLSWPREPCIRLGSRYPHGKWLVSDPLETLEVSAAQYMDTAVCSLTCHTASVQQRNHHYCHWRLLPTGWCHIKLSCDAACSQMTTGNLVNNADNVFRNNALVRHHEQSRGARNAAGNNDWADGHRHSHCRRHQLDWLDQCRYWQNRRHRSDYSAELSRRRSRRSGGRNCLICELGRHSRRRTQNQLANRRRQTGRHLLRWWSGRLWQCQVSDVIHLLPIIQSQYKASTTSSSSSRHQHTWWWQLTRWHHFQGSSNSSSRGRCW